MTFFLSFFLSYAARKEEDDSDECEVAPERSEAAKTRVRIILFLPCNILYFFSCMHRNGHLFCLKRGKKIPFLGYTRKMWELFTNVFRQSENSTKTILQQLLVFTTMKLAVHTLKFSQRTYLLVR